jgi:hypothetical protein
VLRAVLREAHDRAVADALGLRAAPRGSRHGAACVDAIAGKGWWRLRFGSARRAPATRICTRTCSSRT